MLTAAAVTIRPAENERDGRAVLGAITLAFSTDPMTRWALPDPATYLEAMPRLALALGGGGLATRATLLVDGGLAAAMWLPPGVHPDTERIEALTKEYVSESRLSDIAQVYEQMSVYHPADPHWFLPLIGVDPACQGRGYGSELLRYAVERCDRDRLPAYLESTNARNVPLYERFGFRVMGVIQAGTSPTIVPMLRQPR